MCNNERQGVNVMTAVWQQNPAHLKFPPRKNVYRIAEALGVNESLRC